MAAQNALTEIGHCLAGRTIKAIKARLYMIWQFVFESLVIEIRMQIGEDGPLRFDKSDPRQGIR